ncbi:type II secretion system secretin GspD [Thiomicrorhabdus arctica]|uniref:type II secretion system secretin GspD n=1 Tax=Thiomicrorhabdus arctica TaxID=131540 RepID=UPI001FE060EF|nr:type II secretion system secretin GspD [Thiomicrorhabdus arctica]
MKRFSDVNPSEYTLKRSGRWMTSIVLALSISLTCIGNVQAEGEMKQSFKQVDITTVIESVAKITGRNFIIDPRVKGKVTLLAEEGMAPETLYQTLLAVLSVHGYVAIPGDGIIKIVPANLARDQLPYRGPKENDDDWVTEVISVHNVASTALVATLRPLVAREGHLVALAESNKLIITDTVANIKRIKSVLMRVDIDSKGAYEVIEVKNASAEELVKTIKTVLQKGQGDLDVQVSFDERSNRIVLTGEEHKRMILRALIADLDIKVDNAGRVQVIYLRYAKAIEMVPILQKIAKNKALLNAAESAGPEGGSGVKGAISIVNSISAQEDISIEADERMNAIILSAPMSIITALKSVITQLDIRRAQVLIEAIFVEVSEDKSRQLGVEWGVLGENGVGLVNFSGSIPTILGNVGNPLAQSSAIGRGISMGFGEVSADGSTGWGGLIKALSSDSGSNILATPSIVTLDNEEAEIVVGKEVPFQTGTYTNTANSVTNPFSTIQRKNVGLKLKVTPQILNQGNEVYLEIDQEVSDVLPKGEAVDIQTTKRQIKTQVIVGDGNMIVLGGLITEKETEVESKIPGLGDIPGLGQLFTSSENKREKVNLMVFLRPVIIKNNAMNNFYSQKKYNKVVDEQNGVLQRMNTDRLAGEVPRLPSLNVWQEKKVVVKPIKKAPNVKVNEKSKPLINPMSTDELLGL